LFDRLLHTMFDEMLDVPGVLVYQHDLARFHAGHMHCLVRHPLDPTVVSWRRRLDARRGEVSPSFVAATGQIRNSFISSGVEIAGLVENSVLFPGVTVAPNAEVYNSVLMNDNHVGPRCIIRNTLVLPNRKETLRASVNLHESAEIGGPSRSTRNADYPQQIHSGLTVLGVSAEVPRGLRIEEGVYLSGAFSVARLRKLRKVAGGTTLGEKDR
jgi:ADP-glucose pyrophosphorylase